MTQRYATLDELKSWLGITDATDNIVLGKKLDEACRNADEHLGRFFYQTAAGTALYYTADKYESLLIDDCVALTEVATDEDGDRTYETVWAAGDYDLTPYNAAGKDRPYTKIAVTPLGDYYFPAGVAKGVKLTGTWGWPKVPEQISGAVLMRAARLFKRRETPTGLSGNADLGIIRVNRFDGDYDELVELFGKLVAT
jgi:hypothetical protein